MEDDYLNDLHSIREKLKKEYQDLVNEQNSLPNTGFKEVQPWQDISQMDIKSVERKKVIKDRQASILNEMREIENQIFIIEQSKQGKGN